MSNNQSITIDIQPYLAEALSTNSKVYKSIDQLYNRKQDEFNLLAKQSEFYTHPIASEGNIEHEYYFKKALGIIAYTNENEDQDIIEDFIRIIKRGWPYSYSYVQNNSIIRISTFMEKFIKKNKGMRNIGDDLLNSSILTLICLTGTYKKPIDNNDEFYIHFLNGLHLRNQHYCSEWRINFNNEDKETKKWLRELELKLRSRNPDLAIPLGKHKDFKIDNKMIKKDRFIFAFDFIYDIERISLVTLVADKYITSNEIQELILTYAHMYKNDRLGINLEELEKFIYSAVQIKYLCRELKKAKKFFFENFAENKDKEISTLTQTIGDLKTENSQLKQDLYLAEQEVKKYQKENTRLKLSNEEIPGLKKELIALREYFFNSENDCEVEHQSLCEDISNINSIEGVIIGGYPKWQMKMKEILPSWTFIDVDALNFDTNLLKKDYVFINTIKNSHGMYYKVIENIGVSTKLKYINNNNVDICLSNIAMELKR